ncbi:MAG: thrombospondin type 3 repeat-containing protein, partial [Polyangia bacterium]
MRATRLAIVSIALLFLGTVAHADPLKLEIGVFGGYHYFSQTNQLGRDVGVPNDSHLHQTGTFGLRIGFVVHPLVVLEAELGLIPTTASTSAGRATALDIGYRAHLVVHVLKGRFRPFLLAGGGGATLSSSNPLIVHQDTDGEFHFGVGLKADITKSWGLRLDGRLYIEPSTNADKIYATNDYEVTLGIYGLFGGAKKVPAPEPKLVVPPDIDGDGILNADDLCPEKMGPAANHGCPDVDTDGDLIVDRLDKCPKDKGIEENGGCPDVDTDKDGVVDRLDKCPEVAGVPENGGCPDTDTDKDGVPDRLDKCPNEPETVNGYKDLDGCPDELPVAVKKYT